jgi:hypothetical protein
VLEIAELGEAGLRAFGFWLFLFSPKYRAQVAHDWGKASAGRRVALGFEGLLAVVLGVGCRWPACGGSSSRDRRVSIRRLQQVRRTGGRPSGNGPGLEPR